MNNPILRSCSLAVAIALSACVDDDGQAADATDDGGTTLAPGDGEATEADSGSDLDPTTSGGDTTGDEPGDSGSTGDPIDIDALYACEDPDLIVVRPLSGPGIDPETGLLEPLEPSYVASATIIMLEPDDDSQREFQMLNAAVVEALEQSDGMVGYGLAFEPNCGFGRTVSLWRNEAAMYAFVGSNAHAQAIARAGAISITGKTTSWEVTAKEAAFSWETAREELGKVDPFDGY
jgi:quinol monooxygenase YgiN